MRLTLISPIYLNILINLIDLLQRLNACRVCLQWYPEIRQHCDNTPVILCGCQNDLRNDIETISALAKQHKIPVTSEQVTYSLML